VSFITPCNIWRKPKKVTFIHKTVLEPRRGFVSYPFKSRNPRKSLSTHLAFSKWNMCFWPSGLGPDFYCECMGNVDDEPNKFLNGPGEFFWKYYTHVPCFRYNIIKIRWGIISLIYFFYCCTMHFDNIKILFTNECTLY
jgi:hypothetical protein